MPTKPPRPCSYPGCPLPAVAHGRCVAHARLRDRQRGSSAARGYGAAWQRQRVAYLAEHPYCVRCLAAGRYVLATDVHHLVPVRAGGSNEWENLAGLCHGHHSQTTRRDNVGG